MESRVDPELYQPPLRWYSHLWRDLVALSIGLVIWVQIVEVQAEETPFLFALDIALGVLSLVLVHWRRRWPMTIAVVTSLLAPFSSITAGASTLALVSLATRRVWWQVIVIGALNLPLAFLYWVVQPRVDDTPLFLELAIGVVAIGATLGWGMFIGSRRELLYTLRLRAENAEAERDARAREARVTERARIAREMHDVLAHRISQISMHAGALTFREDLTAEQMRESAAVIQDRAHEALTDLREVLGVLREDTGSIDRPQPTYGDLPALVEEAADDGNPVDLDDRLPAAPPEAVGRTIYRIVQEGITNARKHAPGARLSVTVDGSPDEGIEVCLSNALGFGPTRTPGAGLGLVGLAERTEVLGGRVEHGVERTSDGPRFIVRAWLPWAA